MKRIISKVIFSLRIVCICTGCIKHVDKEISYSYITEKTKDSGCIEEGGEGIEEPSGVSLNIEEEANLEIKKLPIKEEGKVKDKLQVDTKPLIKEAIRIGDEKPQSIKQASLFKSLSKTPKLPPPGSGGSIVPEISMEKPSVSLQEVKQVPQKELETTQEILPSTPIIEDVLLPIAELERSPRLNGTDDIIYIPSLFERHSNETQPNDSREATPVPDEMEMEMESEYEDDEEVEVSENILELVEREDQLIESTPPPRVIEETLRQFVSQSPPVPTTPSLEEINALFSIKEAEDEDEEESSYLLSPRNLELEFDAVSEYPSNTNETFEEEDTQALEVLTSISNLKKEDNQHCIPTYHISNEEILEVAKPKEEEGEQVSRYALLKDSMLENASHYYLQGKTSIYDYVQGINTEGIKNTLTSTASNGIQTIKDYYTFTEGGISNAKEKVVGILKPKLKSTSRNCNLLKDYMLNNASHYYLEGKTSICDYIQGIDTEGIKDTITSTASNGVQSIKNFFNSKQKVLLNPKKESLEVANLETDQGIEPSNHNLFFVLNILLESLKNQFNSRIDSQQEVRIICGIINTTHNEYSVVLAVLEDDTRPKSLFFNDVNQDTKAISMGTPYIDSLDQRDRNQQTLKSIYFINASSLTKPNSSNSIHVFDTRGFRNALTFPTTNGIQSIKDYLFINQKPNFKMKTSNKIMFLFGMVFTLPSCNTNENERKFQPLKSIESSKETSMIEAFEEEGGNNIGVFEIPLDETLSIQEKPSLELPMKKKALQVDLKPLVTEEIIIRKGKPQLIKPRTLAFKSLLETSKLPIPIIPKLVLPGVSMPAIKARKKTTIIREEAISISQQRQSEEIQTTDFREGTPFSDEIEQEYEDDDQNNELEEINNNYLVEMPPFSNEIESLDNNVCIKVPGSDYTVEIYLIPDFNKDAEQKVKSYTSENNEIQLTLPSNYYQFRLYHPNGYIDDYKESYISENCDIVLESDHFETLVNESILQGNTYFVTKIYDELEYDTNAANDFLDESGNNLLHRACSQNNHEMVMYLLVEGEAHMLLTKENLEGLTPIDLILQSNDHSLLDIIFEKYYLNRIEFIFENFLEINDIFEKYSYSRECIKNSRDGDGNSFLHLVCNYLSDSIRISDENKKIVSILLEEDLELIDVEDSEGKTVLKRAIEHERANIFRELLSNNSIRRKVINILKSYSDQTNMSNTEKRAARFIINNLVRGGLNRNEIEEIRRILKNAQNNRNYYLMKLLVKKGVNPITYTTRTGGTNFHRACLDGDLEAVKALLSNDRTIPNFNNLRMTDEDGFTPLHIAVIRNHNDIVRFLIEKGVSIDLEDSKGRTALYIAIRNGYHELAGRLLDRGASFKNEANDQFSPVFCAFKYSTAIFFNTFMQKVYRNTQGANDPYWTNQLGWSLLHLAVSNGGNIPQKDDKAKSLIRYGADMNHRDNSGNTPQDLVRDTVGFNMSFREAISNRIINDVRQRNLRRR